MTNPQEQKRYADYVFYCNRYSVRALPFEEWLKTTTVEDEQYFAYVDDLCRSGKAFLDHAEWLNRQRLQADPSGDRRWKEYLDLCVKHDIPSMRYHDEFLNSSEDERARYFELVPVFRDVWGTVDSFSEWVKEDRQARKEEEKAEKVDPSYPLYLNKCRNYGVFPITEAEYWDSNNDEHDRYFEYVASMKGYSCMSHSEWLRKSRLAQQPEIQIAQMLDLNALYHDYGTNLSKSDILLDFQQWKAKENNNLIRYEQHLKVCAADGVQFIGFEEWKLFDKEYLQHVATASHPMTPSKYQRNKWDSKKAQENHFSVQQLEAEVLDLNHALSKSKAETAAALIVNEQLTVKLSEAEQKVEGLDNLYREACKDRQSVESDSTVLQKELLLRRKEVQELSDEVNTLENKLKERTCERDRLASSLQTSQETCHSYFVEKERAQEELANKYQYIKDLHAEHEKVHNELKLCEVVSRLKDTRPALTPTRIPPQNQPEFPHYFREVPETTSHIDVYWVLKAWDVTDPCVQHAIKKLMAAGMRGAKDVEKDLHEAARSIHRALELRK
jgi:hypothetical protein